MEVSLQQQVRDGGLQRNISMKMEGEGMEVPKHQEVNSTTEEKAELF